MEKRNNLEYLDGSDYMKAETSTIDLLIWQMVRSKKY